MKKAGSGPGIMAFKTCRGHHWRIIIFSISSNNIPFIKIKHNWRFQRWIRAGVKALRNHCLHTRQKHSDWYFSCLYLFVAVCYFTSWKYRCLATFSPTKDEGWRKPHIRTILLIIQIFCIAYFFFFFFRFQLQRLRIKTACVCVLPIGSVRRPKRWTICSCVCVCVLGCAVGADLCFAWVNFE